MESVADIRILATKKAAEIAEENKTKAIAKSLTSTGSSVRKGENIRLPKIEIPHFNGTITNWQPFWDKFSALVHASSIPTISKFTYLDSFLTSDAKSAVAGLALTEDNYVSRPCWIPGDHGQKKQRLVFLCVGAWRMRRADPFIDYYNQHTKGLGPDWIERNKYNKQSKKA